MVVSVEKADYLGGYKIKSVFSDGVSQIGDFEDFLTSAKNLMTKKYLDLDKFRNYSIEYGDIVWNDYEMCFPVWDLDEGNS